MEVIEPMEARTMTRVEKRSALEYLMFLKKKWCSGINDFHAVQLFCLSDDNLVPFLPKHLKSFLDGVLCECHVF